jgi:hypothetical protein
MLDRRQIDVRFDGPTLAQIEEIERLTGKSVSMILRESVNFTNWLYKEWQTGARFLIERPGSETPLQKVVFRT